MRYHTLATKEAQFLENPPFFISPVTVANPDNPAETVVLDQVRKKDGDTSFYFNESKPKKRVCLHFTMGELHGDMGTLTQKGNPVSVPFVIARSGNIMALFQSAFWSYHVGKKAVGGNKTISSTSIGIELTNLGPLTLKGSTLHDWTGKAYCALSDTRAYVKLPAKYRDYLYYATFTDAQYDSLGKLLRLMLAKWKIPATFLSPSQRYSLMTPAQAVAFAGIMSHVNVRTDKVDIGPAFDWARVANSV